jgi:flagellar basal body-associated protein FliL
MQKNDEQPDARKSSRSGAVLLLVMAVPLIVATTGGIFMLIGVTMSASPFLVGFGAFKLVVGVLLGWLAWKVVREHSHKWQ